MRSSRSGLAAFCWAAAATVACGAGPGDDKGAERARTAPDATATPTELCGERTRSLGAFCRRCGPASPQWISACKFADSLASLEKQDTGPIPIGPALATLFGCIGTQSDRTATAGELQRHIACLDFLEHNECEGLDTETSAPPKVCRGGGDDLISGVCEARREAVLAFCARCPERTLGWNLVCSFTSPALCGGSDPASEADFSRLESCKRALAETSCDAVKDPSSTLPESCRDAQS